MGAEGRMEIAGLCDRCTGCGAGGSDEQTLYDLAHMDERTLSSLMNESQHGLKELHEKAWEHARERLSRLRGTIEGKRGELQDLKEAFSYRLLEQLAAGGGVDELLGEYVETNPGGASKKSLPRWTRWKRPSSLKISGTA